MQTAEQSFVQIVDGKSFKVVNGTWYDAKTPDEVIRILELCRADRTRIRIRLGDIETGRDWLEEWDVEGRVGRNTGVIKIPLLITNEKHGGGGGILSGSIVKILNTKTHKVYYQAENYNLPKLTIHTGQEPDLPYEVWADDKLHARFSTEVKASKWVRKMSL